MKKFLNYFLVFMIFTTSVKQNEAKVDIGLVSGVVAAGTGLALLAIYKLSDPVVRAQ